MVSCMRWFYCTSIFLSPKESGVTHDQAFYRTTFSFANLVVNCKGWISFLLFLHHAVIVGISIHTKVYQWCFVLNQIFTSTCLSITSGFWHKVPTDYFESSIFRARGLLLIYLWATCCPPLFCSCCQLTEGSQTCIYWFCCIKRTQRSILLSLDLDSRNNILCAVSFAYSATCICIVQ